MMTWTSRRNWRRSVPLSAGNGLPWYNTSPRVGSIRPNNNRASVVLPEPDSPTMAVIDGGSLVISSEKSSSAVFWPRLNRPPPKILVTWRHSRNALISAGRFYRPSGGEEDWPRSGPGEEIVHYFVRV